MKLRIDHQRTEAPDESLAAGDEPKSNMTPNGRKDPPEGFRRLHKNEVVSRGDYVLNDLEGVELWEGPGGFRADSFVKQIYRRISAA